jgi:hypothetical protein
MGVSDIFKLNDIIKIIDYGNDKEMYEYIKKNKDFFFKKIPVVHDGVILHALSSGSDYFKQFDSFLYKFSPKINKIIDYLDTHTEVFKKIVDLEPKHCEILDNEGFTPYDIAMMETYDRNHKIKLC